MDGHRLWAPTYDTVPNPLIALEDRVLGAYLGSLQGLRILDVAAGTGRWMSRAAAEGAQIFGIDLCQEMLFEASKKPSVRGRTVRAHACALPLKSVSFDIAICSFALGYIDSPRNLIGEMARVARRVIVSDLHPSAACAGWKRSFRAEGEVYEMEHHPYSAAEISRAAAQVGLEQEARMEWFFEEPEQRIFMAAGKAELFESAKSVPAVLINVWTHP